MLTVSVHLIQISVFVAGIAVASAHQQASSPAGEASNVVRSIRARGPVVEIELHSPAEFAVRSERIILRIGNKEFTRSRYGNGGKLDTLVFIIPKEEFDSLEDAADITVGHGRRELATGRRHFGRLDKALLERQ